MTGEEEGVIEGEITEDIEEGGEEVEESMMEGVEEEVVCRIRGMTEAEMKGGRGEELHRGRMREERGRGVLPGGERRGNLWQMMVRGALDLALLLMGQEGRTQTPHHALRDSRHSPGRKREGEVRGSGWGRWLRGVEGGSEGT